MPNFLPFFIKSPLPPRHHIRKIAVSKGKTVPNANKVGRINPYELDKTTGKYIQSILLDFISLISLLNIRKKSH
jgi:hypothetical protein